METGWFFPRLLAKWGIETEEITSGKYKTFYNLLTHSKHNKDSRSSSLGYLTSWKDQVVEDVALDQGLAFRQASTLKTLLGAFQC